VRQDAVPVRQLDTEHGVGQRVLYNPFDFNCFLLRRQLAPSVA
jgi:hypothetical protein